MAERVHEGRRQGWEQRDVFFSFFFVVNRWQSDGRTGKGRTKVMEKSDRCVERRGIRGSAR